MTIVINIPVEARPKKNNPRILWKKADKPFQIKFGKWVACEIGYRPMIIPSEGNEEFETAIMPYFKEVLKTTGIINYPINVQAIYYRSSKHKIDLSNLHEALHDSMVKSGLILDDNRDIIAGHDGSRVFYDKFNPRIEITITEMKDYVQWNDTKNKQGRLF